MVHYPDCATPISFLNYSWSQNRKYEILNLIKYMCSACNSVALAKDCGGGGSRTHGSHKATRLSKPFLLATQTPHQFLTNDKYHVFLYLKIKLPYPKGRQTLFYNRNLSKMPNILYVLQIKNGFLTAGQKDYF